MKSSIYFMRHGQAWWNTMAKMQGQVNIPLTETGRVQASKVASQLSAVNFGLCLTSPLSRASKTAEVVLKGRSVPIIEEPLLMEQAYGIAEGDSHAGFNIVGSAVFGYETQPEAYVAPVGGESFEQLYVRAQRLLDERLLPAATSHNCLLIVSHAALLCALSNIVIQNRSLVSFWETKLSPCGVGCFEIEASKPQASTLKLGLFS